MRHLQNSRHMKKNTRECSSSLFLNKTTDRKSRHSPRRSCREDNLMVKDPAQVNAPKCTTQTLILEACTLSRWVSLRATLHRIKTSITRTKNDQWAQIAETQSRCSTSRQAGRFLVMKSHNTISIVLSTCLSKTQRSCVISTRNSAKSSESVNKKEKTEMTK